MDFKTLTSDEFESLAEELLVAKGFAVTSRPSRGPDQGCDLIVERPVTDDMGLTQHERWLVQCKNNATSDQSVKETDIGNLETRMKQHKANRFLLVTATLPSETVKQLFRTLNDDDSSSRKAAFWNRQDLLRLLDEFPDIGKRYQSWAAEAKRLCEHINGDHRLFSKHRGVMAWSDDVSVVYGNDGYDPSPGKEICEYVVRARRQVELLLVALEERGWKNLAFAKSDSGATWVVLVESTDYEELGAMLQSSFWRAYQEQVANKQATP